MFDIYFYTPNMNQPSGGMSVLLKHAKILSEKYSVSLIYQKNNARENIFNPSWLDFDISDLPKIRIDNILDFNIKKDDLLIIPEGFGNIIEATQNSIYQRIVFAQSWIYILSSLSKPISWKKLNINVVISASENLTNYINNIMPGLSIFNYRYSISAKLFNSSKKKSNFITYQCRGPAGQQKVDAIIKMFKILSPEHDNIEFIHLAGFDKVTFAKMLADSLATIYTDEIACIATLPLESMAANTPVVGWDYGTLDYSINNNNMFLVKNGDCFALAKKLSEVIINYFNGVLPDFSGNYKKTLDMYSENQEENSILEIYRILLDQKSLPMNLDP